VARVTTDTPDGRRTPARPAPSGAAIICAFAILIVAVFRLNLPYYFALTPGPAPDVVQLIEISGVKTKPVSGRLLLTTVSLSTIRVAQAIRSWFDANYEIIPRSAVVPEGESEQEAERRTSQQMDESQQNAAAAALAFLGYEVKIIPIGARVAEIFPDGPAVEVLRRGDVIVGADTVPVRRSEDVRAVISRHEVGDEVALKIRRGADTITVKTRTVGNPQDPTKPIIGVILQNVPRLQLPVAVDIESLGIGGPSAGLMYALGIVDLMDAPDLTRGRTIAGTGAISPQGDVQPVGGIRQKVAAALQADADLFIAPLDELREACERADDMPVVGVHHLREAVEALRAQRLPKVRSCS
jgi:PDZ domain-containing protein